MGTLPGALRLQYTASSQKRGMWHTCLGRGGSGAVGVHQQCLLCSKDYGHDPMAPEERRRTVLSIIPQHWAVEWLRPVPPDCKMVGPILPEPGQPLPADLEVACAAVMHGTAAVPHCSLPGCHARVLTSACVCMQAFMDSAGEQGVLLVSTGTMTELRARSATTPRRILFNSSNACTHVPIVIG